MSAQAPSTKGPRTKILCVRPRPNPASNAVLTGAVDEWVHSLSLHADVEQIEQDFDWLEVYERVRPDFLLFDSVHWGRRHRLNIAHIDAHPEVPRALLLNSDPHDPMRPLMMDMLSTYRIDTLFCTGIEDVQQMPELRRLNCFVLPKFIDADVFREYDEPKSIPLTIMSAHLFPTFYPWRAKVTEEVQKIIPTLLYTHPGYNKDAHSPFEIRDESYARMLSRSRFAVADTTTLDYVVRKHLEIPACGTILVAPESEPLRDYGFVDLENCILGSGEELYAKILAVAGQPDHYERIRQAGHALVHGRYTRKNWTHILDWYACRRSLKPGEMVQQQGVFGGFRAVAAGAHVASIANFTVQDNPMGVALRAARQVLLHGGNVNAVVAQLTVTMKWINHVAEPWFMMAVIAFVAGDLESAGSWLARRSAAQGAEDATLGLLDPVEIAWLMFFAHVIGDEELYQQMTDRAAGTAHVAIRRMIWLTQGATPVTNLADAGLDRPRADDCPSIHWLGDESFDEWAGLVQKILAANGQAEALAS
ncbi:MAG: glycosyltransferase [Sphingobium sp.]